MHEILRTLRPGSLVLDLGCGGGGSFPEEVTLATVVRVDRDPPRGHFTRFVQSDAACLPFANHTFAAVILNHSLEHFDDANGSLREVGRVMAPSGALYVAVPDASTFTDRFYRWLAKGGGHVNAFTLSATTAAIVQRATGLPLVATRVLYSSLSFLNRRNSPRPLPRRLLPLGAGYEFSLFLFVWLSRRLDRWLDTRLGVYGWAFYFGNIIEPVETHAWVNVCLRCGSGCPANSLKAQGRLRSVFPGVPIYKCANCGAANPFADD